MQQVFVVIRPGGATKMFVTALATSQAHRATYRYDENNRNANCNTANIRAIVTHPARHAPHVSRVTIASPAPLAPLSRHDNPITISKLQ